MSTTGETFNNPISTDTANSNRNCTYWIRENGYEFITDPNGEVVNLARLTAYAEHGDEIYDAEAHHELPQLKVDAPAYLDALPKGEHRHLHNSDSSHVEVEGVPLLRADR